MDGNQNSGETDPLDGLEARLKSHAAAFESLLALTPARDYFGSHAVDGRDPSEQWNRKKQSKEEKRAAKKAKLDPVNQKSALDVLREKEVEALRKRKRDSEGGIEGEEQVGKRVKVQDGQDVDEVRRRERAEKKKEKRERKRERKVAKKARAEAKKARKEEQTQQSSEQLQDEAEDDSDENAEAIGASEMEGMDFSGLDAGKDASNEVEEDMDDAASQHSSAPTTPVVNSPAFDLGTNHSAASSSSSIVPPSIAPKPTKTQQSKPEPAPAPAEVTTNTLPTPKPDTSAPAQTSAPISRPQSPSKIKADAQSRLKARIDALRAARKADGSDGAPARTRAELLENRRQADAKRKAAKKEQRAKEKEEEARRREEQLRGSGSPLSGEMGMGVSSPRSPQPSNSYSFSRLAFQDGTAATSSLSGLQEAGRKKGPRDPATALKAAQSKQSRLAGYDAEKRGEIEEKDSWLNARKRAQGERVRDDVSLLKKALKRKEKGKGKSEKEWRERGEGVVRGREVRQKKREANLAKRREEKGGKGKGKKGKGKPGPKKKRAGFEGRFKA